MPIYAGTDFSVPVFQFSLQKRLTIFFLYSTIISQNRNVSVKEKEERDMPLVTSEKMLSDAQKGGYAVGAFNVENMEMAKAVIAAAEEMRSPVMLQTTPSTVKYGSLETFAAIVKAEASKTDIPVCLHLDHGNSFELAV